MKIKNEKTTNKTQDKKSLVTHPKYFGTTTKRGDSVEEEATGTPDEGIGPSMRIGSPTHAHPSFCLRPNSLLPKPRHVGCHVGYGKIGTGLNIKPSSPSDGPI